VFQYLLLPNVPLLVASAAQLVHGTEQASTCLPSRWQSSGSRSEGANREWRMAN